MFLVVALVIILVVVLVLVRQILTGPLENITRVIPALTHEPFEPIPIDALARHVRTHAEVVPRTVRPVEPVGGQIGVAHHRGAQGLEAVG